MPLGILYPLILLANFWAYRRTMRKNEKTPLDEKKRVYREIFKLNVHPTILFGRHLFIDFRKEADLSAEGFRVNRFG